ncbi:hypothetical protein ABGN05_29255 [Aquibium sp. LZ166]|uniref:Transposase n=1 Tax=Aquibium pacificus TaxID=3153579 RepID=A0ABV3SU46_9HYPH
MVAMNRNKNDRNDARSIAHLIRSGDRAYLRRIAVIRELVSAII